MPRLCHSESTVQCSSKISGGDSAAIPAEDVASGRSWQASQRAIDRRRYMYDLRFIFEECGFGEVPDYIDRSRLFNVSLDLTSGDIKLYVLDASERFAHKITRSGITRQYSGDDPEHGGDHGRLERHLKCKLLEREIVIDAVEDETYYVYLDDAGVEQSLLFLRALCRVHGLAENAVLQSINEVCGNSFASIAAALAQHAVSLVKVP